MGRGFAVVADEVRTLAGKVRRSRRNRRQHREMADLSTAPKWAREIDELTAETREVIQRSTNQIGRMVQDFETNHEQLVGVSAAIESYPLQTAGSHSRISEIHDLGSRIREEWTGRTNIQPACAAVPRDTGVVSLQSRYRQFRRVLSKAAEWRSHSAGWRSSCCPGYRHI